jgi:beta-glucosidase-like glycosyl hydrolase
MTRLIQENWDGMSITDWGIITGPMADWGVENMSTSERIVRLWTLGTDHLGLISNMDQIADAYAYMVDEKGQEEADLILRNSVYEFFRVECKLGLFENPYLDKAYAVAMCGARMPWPTAP